MISIGPTAIDKANSEIIITDRDACKVYDAHLNEYDGEILYIVLFADYGRLVLEYLENGKTDKAKTIIDLMEKYISSGDKSLSEAASTGFLESIDHTISDGSYTNKLVITNIRNMLGKESLAYCRAYEEFWTKKTEFWK